jgi:hypothetical protein
MPFTQQIINSDKLQGILDIPEEFRGRNDVDGLKTRH